MNNIRELKIYGHSILMDDKQGFIIFPQDCTEEQIERIACYLDDEGLLRPEQKPD